MAGKQKGKEDDRYLWPEMLRVIRELTPRWVVGENVPGILRIAGRTVCEDLEREGYAVTIFNFEAAAVGAPHRRERVFFVANAECTERRPSESFGYDHDRHDAGRKKTAGWIGTSSENGRAEIMADTKSKRLQRERTSGEQIGGTRPKSWKSERCGDVCDTSSERFSDRSEQPLGRRKPNPQSERPDWWSIEPDVGRVANGVPSRVDRLKCLGNAVVPQQAYPIFRSITMAEQWAGPAKEE